MIRHFTATGLVVHEDAVLLVEHIALGCWLPPGGHVGRNEDPAQAVVREVREETGVACEIVSDELFAFSGDGIASIPRPFAILLEDLPDDDGSLHQHIDHIYLLRPLSDPQALSPQDGEVSAVKWVPRGEVGKYATPPDVPLLVDAVFAHLARSTSAQTR